jgi:ribosome-associated toxin RatA of RatAB toxin-antitoxin module
MNKIIIVLIISCYVNLYANNFTLNQEELKILKQNGEIIKIDDVSQTGFIVFDVAKNIDKVFISIANLTSYSIKIDDVSKVLIYNEFANIIKAQIFIDSFFISFSNYVIHFVNKKNYKISWHLDDKYKNDNYFAKMNGYWKLKKINDNQTRVFYSNDLEFKSFMPSFLKDILANKGLDKSTSWLRVLQ